MFADNAQEKITNVSVNVKSDEQELANSEGVTPENDPNTDPFVSVSTMTQEIATSAESEVTEENLNDETTDAVIEDTDIHGNKEQAIATDAEGLREAQEEEVVDTDQDEPELLEEELDEEEESAEEEEEAVGDRAQQDQQPGDGLQGYAEGLGEQEKAGTRSDPEKILGTTKDKFTVYSQNLEQLTKARMVYVQPQGYESLIKDIHEQRIYMIFGKEQPWNFLAAIYLGLELLQKQQDSEINLDAVATEELTIPSIVDYRRDKNDEKSLIRFIQSEQEQNRLNTVYVIDDALEKGITIEDLAERYLGHLNDNLSSRESFLILTVATERPVKDIVRGISSQIPHLLTDIPGDDTEFITTLLGHFQKYYRSYSAPVLLYDAVAEKLKNQEETLSNLFSTYWQIDMFYANATRKLSRSSDDQIVLDIAEEIVKLEQTPAWYEFRNLNPNEKLYAMIAVLFDSLPRLIIDKLYIAAVAGLRSKGVENLKDAREFGIYDIMETIHATATEDQPIQFTPPVYGKQIYDLQLKNHHHLLWSLVSDWKSIAKELDLELNDEIRRALGIAIGRLGIYDKLTFKYTLTEFANDQSISLASVPAYALKEICQHPDVDYLIVRQLLSIWSGVELEKKVEEELSDEIDTHKLQQGHSNYMFLWSTGLSIGQIYRTVANRAFDKDGNEKNQEAYKTVKLMEDVLTYLIQLTEEDIDSWIKKQIERKIEIDQPQSPQEIEYIQQYVFGRLFQAYSRCPAGVIVALRDMINNRHSKDAVRILTYWLETFQDNDLVSLVTIYLCQEYTSTNIILVDTIHLPLLKLVEPILSRTAAGNDTDYAPLKTVILMLQTWIVSKPGKEWVDCIHAELLKVCNRTEYQARFLLRSMLSMTFMRSSEIEARTIGQALLSRSYMMDGVPTDMPGQRYGVIAVDASTWGWIGASHLGQLLYERLDGRLDTYVYPMGQTEWCVKPGQLVKPTDLQTNYSFPRLVISGLDIMVQSARIDLSQLHFVVSLAWGAILDVADWDNSQYQERIIVAGLEALIDVDAPHKTHSIRWREDKDIIPLKVQNIYDDLDTIERYLNGYLAAQLASLTSDEWWTTLDTYHSEIEEGVSPDVDLVCQQIDKWAGNLDNVEQSRHPGDVTRTIACTTLWLAKVDFARAITLVMTWLDAFQDDTRYYMGLACTKLIFNVYSKVSPLSLNQAESLILDLAPKVIKTGEWGAIEAVGDALYHWLPDSRLSNYIKYGVSIEDDGVEDTLELETVPKAEYQTPSNQVDGTPSGGTSFLESKSTRPRINLLDFLVDHTNKRNIQNLQSLLGKWVGREFINVPKYATKEEKEEVQLENKRIKHLREIAEYMQVRLMVGKEGRFPELSNQKYGLILLDVSRTARSRRDRRKFITMAIEVARYMSKDIEGLEANTYPVIARMGQRYPITIKSQNIQKKDILPRQFPYLPRLTAPLIEQLEPEQVGFIILLTNEGPLDEDDWFEKWRKYRIPILLYTNYKRNNINTKINLYLKTSEEYSDWAGKASAHNLVTELTKQMKGRIAV